MFKVSGPINTEEAVVVCSVHSSPNDTVEGFHVKFCEMARNRNVEFKERGVIKDTTFVNILLMIKA